ncbi:MAG TPA: DUF4870 domain-containing protein [Acidobacteriaceae bacterium]|jgi:uncharacterized membrane protein
MQCPACHTEVASESAAFCNHCGAPLSAPAATTAAPDPPSAAPIAATAAPAAVPPAAAASSGLSPNGASALAYITFIPAVLFLIIEPYNKTPLVRFHSFQSIGLAIFWFAFWMIMAVISLFLGVIPVVRTMAFFLIPLAYFAFGICIFILWLMAIIKASKGEWYKLPFIGDFALKQAQS